MKLFSYVMYKVMYEVSCILLKYDKCYILMNNIDRSVSVL